MSKKKQKQKKKRNLYQADGIKPLRLSQCMIVKNEEKNIEKALMWAKDIAFEQIVVDTGSTDRTVEIAESMGAKIFHFEWINDFSAAKNFAIEQASGRWIAFLDADEYFSEVDAKKLEEILTGLTNNPEADKKCVAIFCPLYNVDEEGRPNTVFQHCRVFRNLPELRYAGRIHEVLPLDGTPNRTVSEIGIIHTGYSDSAYRETNKARRNIELLENELTVCPDDPNVKCYLADSLRAEGSPESLERAEKLYAEAIEGEGIKNMHKHSAYLNLIASINNRGEIEKAMQLCRKAIDDYPNIPDFYYNLGMILHTSHQYAEAWDVLKECECALNQSIGEVSRSVVISNPLILFGRLAHTAQMLGDKRNMVHYSVLVLKEEKYEKGVLAPLLEILTKDESTTDEDILGLLMRLYDFNHVKDKVIVLVSAKSAGNRVIYDKIAALFTKEEYEQLSIPPFEDVLC